MASEQLFEVGDSEYGFFALVWRSNFRATTGEALEAVLQDQDALAERMPRSFAVPERLKARALRLLTTGVPDGTSVDAEIEAIDAALRSCDAASMGAWAIWGMVLTVLGRFPEVLNAPEESSRSTSYPTDLSFYRSLAAAAGASVERGSSLRKNRRTFREARRRAARLSRLNSESEHVFLGLRAEGERLRGHAELALSLYARAAEEAAKIGYRHHTAILHERRADLLESMRRGTEAALARMTAATLYEEWNARAKARELHAIAGDRSWCTARTQ